MSGDALFVVAYDISCDDERSQVEKLLLGYGFRVQKSVFECRLTERGMRDVRENLNELQVRTGFVLIYRVAPNSKRVALGEVKPDSFDEGYAFIV